MGNEVGTTSWWSNIYAQASTPPCDCGDENSWNGCAHDCASQSDEEFVSIEQVKSVINAAARLGFIELKDSSHTAERSPQP